ncbi:hypothetical protein TNCV_2171561 [Trichonephila clavipes]|nr:hypothetical protein TNCV_2171561 [Trichonephila clavipes]
MCTAAIHYLERKRLNDIDVSKKSGNVFQRLEVPNVRILSALLKISKRVSADERKNRLQAIRRNINEMCLTLSLETVSSHNNATLRYAIHVLETLQKVFFREWMAS